MNRSFRFCAMLVVGLVLFLMAASEHTRAAIIYTGDIAPDNPAAWDTNTEAYIGSTDDDTGVTSGSVTVNDGGDLQSHFCYIGRYCDSTGEVTVDGAGSTWTIGTTWATNGRLYVGYDGNGTLNIANAGAVSNGTANLGYFPGATGVVTVDGLSSTWTNNGNLYVGDYGSGILNITNSGTVTVALNTWVAAGPFASSSGAINFDDTTLTTGGLGCDFDDLAGTGTINTHGLVGDVDLVFDATHGLSKTFTIAENPDQNITINLDIDGSGLMGAGYSGAGTMSISEGSNVSSTGGYIGYKLDSTGMVTVDGVGSTWTNSDNLWVGYCGSGTLSISNGGTVSNRTGFLSKGFGSGEVTVDGAGSTWTNSGDLWVGYSDSGTLDITNGGAVSSSSGVIDVSSAVCVDGIGSTWTNSDRLFIGVDSINNALGITDGGTVSNSVGYIGYNEGSTGVATVDGPSSKWTNSEDLHIGYYGNGTLSITGGAAVSSGTGYIGTKNREYTSDYTSYTGPGCGEVAVDGDGSTWTNSNDLYVGYGGGGTLNITGGGAVSNSTGYIGYERNYCGLTHTVAVDGAGSTWTNNSDLYVGYGGVGTLNITGGGAVSNCAGYIGYSSAGAVTVDGEGSTWTNSGELFVGGSDDSSSSYGTLSITNSGTVSSGTGHIGYKSGPTKTSVVTVDGAGSTWTNSGALYISHNGTNSLNITGGGTLSNDTGYIGRYSNSSSVYTLVGGAAAVTVDGTGSTWTNSGNLYVAYNGNCTLDITDGGAVSSSDGYITYGSSSTGVVTVDGAGSTWTNSGSLYVGYGYSGSGTLNITNSGEVAVANDTWVAQGSNSSGTINLDNATLTTGGLICDFDDLAGTGTINTHGLVGNVDLVFDTTHGLSQTFNVTDNPGQNITINLDVDGSGSMGAGYSGAGTMSILQGSKVSSTDGYIGYKSGSTGTVTVDGAGSAWTNSGKLYVGYSYGHGTLNITDGGAVSNSSSYIGRYSDSMGEVTVDGDGSTWTNSGGLYVGHYYGHGTLHITGGGEVSSSSGYIGYYSGSTGQVTVDGAGSTWTNSGSLYVGRYSGGNGTLNVKGGAAVSSSSGYVGYQSGSTGEVTIDGAGSTWTNSWDLQVDYGGTLNITNGGQVTAGHAASVSGTVNFDNGTLSTDIFGGNIDGLNGTGTINASGLIFDGNFVFDATNGTSQTINLTGKPGQNVTINLNSNVFSALGAGHVGEGTMIVSDGVTVESTEGYIGYKTGSIGQVTVDGTGSTWTQGNYLNIGYLGDGMLNVTGGGAVSSVYGTVANGSNSTGRVFVDGENSTWSIGSWLIVGGGYGNCGSLSITGGGTVESYYMSDIGSGTSSSMGVVTVDGAGSTWTSVELNVGVEGTGTLSITGGGAVSNYYGYVGREAGSTGVVTVDGDGSTWTTKGNGNLYVGYSGTGTLNIANGGLVTVNKMASINSSSSLNINISGDDMFVVGTDFTNDGVVRLSAGAHLAAGTYAPISVGGDWLGIGSYEACGGLWDEMLHTFSVAEVQGGSSGVETILDLSDAPRLDITDDLTGRQVGASFSQGTGTIGFTATAMTESGGLADLSIQLMSNETILSGWNFETDLADGEEVLLSFYIGDGHAVESLNIWHYDDAGNWTEFDASDLTYSDGWASFTVDGFSGYAMIATVPEPTMLSMAALAGLALLALLHRKRPG